MQPSMRTQTTFGIFAPRRLIVVASNGHRRCKSLVRIQNFGAADIAGVNDQANAFRSPQYLGPQQSVSVRDDADQMLFGVVATKDSR